MYIKRLWPAGKPFVETAVWREGYIYIVVVVVGCAQLCALHTLGFRTSKGTTRRTGLPVRETDTISSINNYCVGKGEEKSHSAIIVLFVVAGHHVHTISRCIRV